MLLLNLFFQAIGCYVQPLKKQIVIFLNVRASIECFDRKENKSNYKLHSEKKMDSISKGLQLFLL